MAYCARCGALLEGNYCVCCGASASAPKEAERKKQFGEAGQTRPLERNVASALCYSLGFVTGLLFLWLPPYKHDADVRFHGYQSIFFSVVVFALHAAVTIAALMFSLVSLALGSLVSSLHAVLSTVFFVAWLYLMWKAYRREKVLLPVIGEISERLAGGAEPGAPAGTIGKAA